MLKNISHHALAYFILSLFLIVHAWIYFLVRDPLKQFLLIVSASITYVVWGMIHHFLERHLTRRLLVEYVMIAALAIVVSYVLLATR